MRADADVVVVADVHASEDDPASAAAFVEFLRHPTVERASELWVIGDLFDVWRGAAMARGAFARTIFEALGRVARLETKVVFMAGNRDFLLDAATLGPWGVTVCEDDEATLERGGGSVVLCHGDTLCANDRAYLRLRRVIRSRAVRLTARALPDAVLRRVTGSLRRHSRAAIRRKAIRDVSLSMEAAEATLVRLGGDHLLCGHVHEPRLRRVPAEEGGDSASPRLLGTVGVWSERGGLYGVIHADASIALRRFRTGRERRPEDRVITLDGPAGAGKTTVAKALAHRLGLHALDSGALYRAVTVLILRRAVALDDREALTALLDSMDLRMEQGRRVFLGEEEVTELIRNPEIDQHVSAVASCRAIRARLLPIQQAQAERHGLVADGHDMGTVVFPDADVKFFLDASIEERARRRRSDLAKQGVDTSIDELIADIRRRDELDRSRSHSPLVRDEDAIAIDTTGIERERVIDLLADCAGGA